MAYPQPGDTNVRGTVLQVFREGTGSRRVFGGIVQARWQDWELPDGCVFQPQSPLVFEWSGHFTVSEGDSVLFDVIQPDFVAAATNVRRA